MRENVIVGSGTRGLIRHFKSRHLNNICCPYPPPHHNFKCLSVEPGTRALSIVTDTTRTKSEEAQNIFLWIFHKILWMLCPNLTFLLFENISTRAGKCYHIRNSKQNHLNLNPSECWALGSGTSNLLLSAFVSICTAQQLTWSNIFKYLKLGKGWKRNICVFGVLGRLDLSCDIYLSVDIFPRSRTPVLSLNVKTGPVWCLDAS